MTTNPVFSSLYPKLYNDIMNFNFTVKKQNKTQ